MELMPLFRPIYSIDEDRNLSARMGRVVLLAVLLSAAVGIFLGAALFPRIVEVPVEVEKRVMVRDDRALADARQHVAVAKQTVKNLQAQVALLQARQVRAETVPIQPIVLAPSAKGLEADARAILGAFGVTTVQVQECR